jgi:hypothetical protein
MYAKCKGENSEHGQERNRKYGNMKMELLCMTNRNSLSTKSKLLLERIFKLHMSVCVSIYIYMYIYIYTMNHLNNFKLHVQSVLILSFQTCLYKKNLLLLLFETTKCKCNVCFMVVIIPQGVTFIFNFEYIMYSLTMLYLYYIIFLLSLPLRIKCISPSKMDKYILK